MKRRTAVCLFTLLAFSCVLPVPAADRIRELREELDRIFSDSRLDGAQVGVQVYALDREEVLYEKNASKLYMPASNNKILTAAAALTRLGPDYRFKTDVIAGGPVENGVLQGDLIIVGFGDPCSSARIEPKDPFHAFRNWAARMKELGIRTVAGDIVGDGSAFGSTAYGKGWAWDDLPEGYAAPVCALQFNENLVWLEITPGGKPKEPPSVKMAPVTDYYTIENRLVTGAEGTAPQIDIVRNRFSDSAALRGSVPAGGAVVSRSVAVQYPVLFYLSALRHALREEGVGAYGCDIIERTDARPASSSLLWRHLSPPLSELLGPMMKMSLNLQAETLVRTLGLEFRGEGTFPRGREIVEETLSRMGVPANGYAYADGSGLSRLNLVSTEALVRVLRSMYRAPHFRFFYDAMAVAGIDGTLETRMKNTKAFNNVRAKSGTFANASALSGYVRTADGEMIAFSILANNFVGSRDAAESVQDKALGLLAGFSRGPRQKTDTAAAPGPP